LVSPSQQRKIIMPHIINPSSQDLPSPNIITDAAAKFDRRTFARTWWQGESEMFVSASNEYGCVRINCAEARKPKEESTSSTKATWFIQPLNWMYTGTFKFLQQPLGIFDIDNVVKKFNIVDLEQIEGGDSLAQSDFTTCMKWSVSDPKTVQWEADNVENPSKYRALITLTFLEKEDGDIVKRIPWTVASDWQHGNSLQIVQGSIINDMRAYLADYYHGMTIKSKD
jgi:hypothetical protein